MNEILSKLILIASVHRGGGPEMAEALAQFGASAGRNLLILGPEGNSLAEFHDRVLKRLGSSWQDMRTIPAEEWKVSWIQESRRELLGILRNELNGVDCGIVSDSRLCRLFPLWRPLFDERGWDPLVTIVGRHPLAVCDLLEAHESFSKRKSLLLWNQHYLLAESFTRGFPRRIVSWDDILANPQEEVAKIADFAGLQARDTQTLGRREEPLNQPASKKEAGVLRGAIGKWAETIWRELFLKTDEERSEGELDRILAEYQQWTEELPEECAGRESDQVTRLTQENSRYQKELSHLKLQHVAVHGELGKVTAQRDDVRTAYERGQDVISQALAYSDATVQSRLKYIESRLVQAEKERSRALRMMTPLSKIVDPRQVPDLLETRMHTAKHRRLLMRLEQRFENVEADLAIVREKQSMLAAESFKNRNDGIKDCSEIEEQSEYPSENESLGPRLWNHEFQGGHFALRLAASSKAMAAFSVFGWILPEAETPGELRFLFCENIYTGETGLPRPDVAEMFPESPQAARSGYLIPDIPFSTLGRGTLQIRNGQGEWSRVVEVEITKQDVIDVIDEYDDISASGLFDAEWYVQRHGLDNVSGRGILSHYLTLGVSQRLNPSPLFDAHFYKWQYGSVVRPDGNPLLDYLSHVQSGTRKPNRWFDPAWYLQIYRDTKRTGIEPLKHFIKYGWKEGRNPGPDFNVQKYLDANPDVAIAGVNPLIHFIEAGAREGRKAYANPDSVHWVFEAATVDPNKANLLLVGHVLGSKLFGSERSFFEIVSLIDKEKYNVFCTFPQRNELFFESISKAVSGIAVFDYRWWGHYDSVFQPDVRRFRDILETRNIALVHVNTIMLREPLVAAREAGVPSIVHVRELISTDPHLESRIGRPADEIVETVRSSADYIVANSKTTLQEFDKSGCSFLYYNTVDADELDIPLDAAREKLRVGLISSNVLKKGFEDFIEIAAMAEKRKLALEFVLIGPQTPDLERFLDRLPKKPANLHVAGYASSPKEALESVEVVVCLSLFAESFGRTIAEGMMARRPGIAYNFGAPPELIEDGESGFVVEFRDMEAVLDRLQRLAGDRALLQQMGASARQRAFDTFSHTAGRHQLQAIYDNILKVPINGRDDSPGLVELLHQRHDAKEPLRLAYFMWHFPVPSETFVLNELREFVRLGLDVVVFCKQIPHKDFKPDFDIHWEQVKSPQDLADKLIATRRRIIHSHFIYPTVTDMVWPACDLACIPFTFIAHAQDIFGHENAEKNRIEEVTRSPWCKAIFAPSRFHREYFIDRGVPAEKIILNPQGILVNAYQADAVEKRLTKPTLSLCAIHRFVEKKGLEYAIAAMQKLAVHGISLHLYGYGPLEEQYRRQVEELGLENVHFRGGVTDRDHMLRVFNEHDLFLCPSVRAANGDMDGIPTILMEAMASNVPVVTTAVAGIPDLVQHGVTGLLCKERDADSLAETILDFYRMPKARIVSMVKNARQWVHQRFDVCTCVRTLQRVWKGEGVDVVIVSYNNLTEIREVIRRLYRYTPTPFRLIIVDNGSDPATKHYLLRVCRTRPNVTILWQETNLFVGPGTNLGVEEGDAAHIVYLCGKEGYCLSEGWDQEILNYMEDHTNVGLAGSLGYSPSYLNGADYITNLEKFPLFRNPGFAEKNPDRVFRHVQGGLFAMRRAMYKDIGGFSEKVPHNHTDVEYSYYVESRGWELGEVPGALALYNKTRPGFAARISEQTRVFHPGTPDISPMLTDIAEGKTHYCGICENLVQFRFEDGDATCPECGSRPFERSLYRWLAESMLTHRRLKALSVGVHSSFQPLFKKMFQGRFISFGELLAEIDGQKTIDHANSGMDLIILKFPADLITISETIPSEAFRILKPCASLLTYQQPELAPLAPLAGAIDSAQSTAKNCFDLFSTAGFTLPETIKYYSDVIRYDDFPIQHWIK